MTASVINQWPIGNINSYAPQTTKVANTTGNCLMAVVGWTANNWNSQVNPISYIADDAHNWWIHLESSGASTQQQAPSRCAVWIAPNANAATVVSVACASYVLGLTAEIFEVEGLPALAYADAAVTGYESSTTSLNISSGTYNAGDTLFAVCHIPDANVSVATPSGWTALTPVSTFDSGYGRGGPCDSVIWPYWQTAATGGTLGAAFALTGGPCPASACLVSIPAAGQTITPVRASRPNLKAEAAFGVTPGQYTQPWTWQDITEYAINTQGETILAASRGRQYELNAVEAGDITLNLDNHTGVFTPGNSSSPYYPNVMLNTPVRVSAYWNSKQYPVCAGYVERWPQTFADPQFGIVPMEATDAIGPLSNINMPSALQGEVLLDVPYVYCPCGENYTEANGLPCSNIARVNQRNATYMDAIISYSPSSTRPLATGLMLGLLGDMGTGVGYADSTTGADASPMPGTFYVDPNLPQLTGTYGVTAEWWMLIPTGRTATSSMEIVRVLGNTPNYYKSTNFLGGFGVRFLVYLDGTSQVAVEVADGNGDNDTCYWSQTTSDGLLHHYAFTLIQTSAGAYTLLGYLDGVQKVSQAITGLTGTMNDAWWLSWGPMMYANGGIAQGNNHTIGHVAYFAAALPYTRIAEHHLVGATGATGDSANTRFGKLLAWGNYGGPRASAWSSPSPQFGPADQIQSTSIAANASTVAQSDGGMFFCDAQLNTTYWSRQFLYNRPVKWEFSDAQPVRLNENSQFNGTIVPWTGVNVTPAYSTAQAQSGVGSMMITPNGTSSTAGAQSETFTVSPSTTYQVSVQGLSLVGYSQFEILVNWLTSGGSLISTSTQAINLPAGLWELNSDTFTSPSNAGEANFQVLETGTPASSKVFWVDSAQFLTVPATIPYDPSSSFDYDNTFVSNILQSQRTIDAGNDANTGQYNPITKQWETSGYGATVCIFNQASQNEYFPRGPLELDIETNCDQDAYDICNWNLVAYEQPMFRVATIVLTPSSNPTLWATALSVEQGDIATVTRSPLGGAAITTTVIIQSVQHQVDADNWVTTIQATPYFPGNAVLQADNTPYNAVGTNALAW
jgi:hypothetical protein